MRFRAVLFLFVLRMVSVWTLRSVSMVYSGSWICLDCFNCLHSLDGLDRFLEDLGQSRLLVLLLGLGWTVCCGSVVDLVWIVG